MKKEEINICLDEIEAAQEYLYSKSSSSELKVNCRGWIIKQKARLKELEFKGKMPRKKRNGN